MPISGRVLALGLLAAGFYTTPPALADDAVQLGPRPFFLVDRWMTAR